MLGRLTSEVHELLCTDEVDETCNPRKWTKKTAKKLAKLNDDCNMTAGLEAKLLLAVGARVMLRRNIDTNAGLVNGAIGTVVSVQPNHITVQFDHTNKPYNVEKVKSRFTIMKNYYIYRKQFPLILAYGVTIHKCQGLSLDCAIVDLSDKVFSPGMAYVAVSRVRTLQGLHLFAFDPKSIMVSTSCLNKINRLRAAYRPDLKPYPLPAPPKPARKRKLTGSVQHDEPTPKKPCGANPGPLNKGKQWLGKDNTALPNKTPTKRKRTESAKPRAEQPAKKARSASDTDVVFLFQEPDLPYKFHSVDELWQRTICDFMGLGFRRPNKVTRGGPNVPLDTPRSTCNQTYSRRW